MIPVHYIIVILLLFIVALLLDQYATTLRTQIYKKNVVLETDATLSTMSYLHRFMYGSIAYVIILTLIVTFYSNSSHELDFFYQEFFFGALVSIFIIRIARYIKTIFYNSYLKSNPSQISGSLTLHPDAVRQDILASLIYMLIPVAAITVAVPHPFVCGFATGIVIFIAMISLNLTPLHIK